MVFSCHFQQYFSYITSFINYWWRIQEYLEKTTDLSQVTDKLYHIMFIKYTSPWSGFALTTLVMIDTDCTGSCKSNYHTIMTTTTPTWALKKSLKIISTCIIIKLSWNYSMFWILINLLYKHYHSIYLILIEYFVEHTKSTIEKDLKENKANASEISTLQGDISQLQSKLSDVSHKLEVSSKELNKEQAKSRSASKHSQVHIKYYSCTSGIMHSSTCTNDWRLCGVDL
jgi:hypothetical protein